jgi:hypothetical protein
VIVERHRRGRLRRAHRGVARRSGPHGARLEVVLPQALFALWPSGLGPRNTKQRLRLWLARHRRVYPLGVKSGWRGNHGWGVQQALKLAAARYGDAPSVLLLDAISSGR